MNIDEFSGKVKEAFSETKPSEEFLEVLMKTKNTKKKKRRILVKVIAAAAAVCILGTAGVYAVPEIKFEEAFGDSIKVSDSELGTSLLGIVHNFKYYVSDDAYAIRILGVTGDSSRMYLNAEIYRKDGKPVKDYIKHFTDENGGLETPQEFAMYFTNCGAGYGSYLNKSGNIEMEYELTSEKNNMNGKKFIAMGADVFSGDLYHKQTSEKSVYVDFSLSDRKNHVYKDHVDGEEDYSTLEDIIGLKLNWKFSFKYQPSKQAEIKKECIDIYEDFIINKTGFPDTDGDASWTDEDTISEEILCTPSKIEFTSIKGELDYSYVPGADCKSSPFFLLVNADDNDIYIINDDGSRVDLHLFSSEIDSKDTISVKSKIDYVEYYENEEGEIKYNTIFTDVSKFKELHINGTVFEII